MNYPVWYLPGVGGGLLMAIIAITHVFVSHFAVGGGLYLVLTERKARRENDAQLLEFVKKHAKFFMLASMVYGGVTGVGIWFTIGLIQPDATSDLIHTFVFGWAAEWVWFLVEIVALLIYYYCFDRMDEQRHLLVGWIYFLAAWMSLFLINGIIGFMLTPGDWLENRNFWSAFFNPSFWPSLLFRCAMATLLAGVFAFFSTALISAAGFRQKMTRYTSRWCLLSLLVAGLAGFWYLQVLPGSAQQLLAISPTIQRSVIIGAFAVLSLAALVTLFTLWRPAWHNLTVALLVALSSLLVMGAFEWIREADRRPFVIYQWRYSNGIAVSDAERLNSGFLAQCRYSREREVREDNLMAAGAELFRFQCYACHTLGGINNDLRTRTASASFPGMVNYLTTMHEKRPFMPPFIGNELERQALAAFLVGELHGKPVQRTSQSEAHPGETLFAANSCDMCHEAELVFNWAQGKSLAEVDQGLATLSQIDSSMKDFSGTEAERQALAEYLLDPHRTAVAAAALSGLQVLEEHCVLCHDAQLTLDWAATRDAEAIRHGLLHLSQINSSMEDFAGSEAELDALVLFLAGQAQGGVQ